MLGERNLAVSCIIMFCAFAVLYAASIALPAMLQALFGYDAYHAGLVLSPGGISSICMLVIVGFLLGRGVDARWLIAAGLIVLAISNYWMAHLNLLISPWQVVWPRMVLTAGLGLIFAPINVAAYMYVPKHLRGSAIALVSLLRNEGGSVGTSMSQTIQERRDQFHLQRLNEYLDPLNPHVTSYLEQAQAFFYHMTGDPVASQQMALQGAGRPAAAAGVVAGVLRRLLAGGGAGVCAGAAGVFDEADGGGKGRARRGGLGATCSRLTGVANPLARR